MSSFQALILLLLRNIVCAVATACYDAGGFTSVMWPHCQQINSALFVYYGITDDGNYLKLGLHAAGHTGWSSLGLAGNGGMKGASMIVVRKVDGDFIAEDRHSLSYSEPQLDTEQNVRLIFATEERGSTSWGVLIPKQSCDVDDYPIDDVSRWMLWAKAMHSASQSEHPFGFHGDTRGQFHANLVSGPATTPDLTGVHEVAIQMSNVAVVSAGADVANPYICEIFDLREVLGAGYSDTNKQHVVKFAAHIDTEYVHHIVLYQCLPEQGFDQPTHNHKIADCEDMPKGCYQMKYAWAVGSEDITLPHNVGMPFGEGRPWLALQIHYYNPRSAQNIRDSSGVTLSFASAPRAQDAGVLLLNGGASPLQRDPLPPGHVNHVLPSFIVPAECTTKWNEDLHVLGVFHHAHLLGKQITIDVSREGSSLGVLRSERRFDFNHQSIEQSPVPMLRRGDQLNLTCSYDTSSRSKPTPFADWSEAEMCLGAVLYYPLQGMPRASYRTPTATDCSGYETFTAIEPSIPTCAVSGIVTSAAAEAYIQTAAYARPSPPPVASSSSNGDVESSDAGHGQPIPIAWTCQVLLFLVAQWAFN